MTIHRVSLQLVFLMIHLCHPPAKTPDPSGWPPYHQTGLQDGRAQATAGGWCLSFRKCVYWTLCKIVNVSIHQSNFLSAVPSIHQPVQSSIHPTISQSICPLSLTPTTHRFAPRRFTKSGKATAAEHKIHIELSVSLFIVFMNILPQLRGCPRALFTPRV